jgi:ribosomal-protein-alanine N-acetyltransferase
MRIEHIPVVAAIERRCFTQPWPQNAYRREIQSNKMAHYFVARLFESDLPSPAVNAQRSAGPHENGLFGRLSRLLRGPLEPPPSPALEAELRSIVG